MENVNSTKVNFLDKIELQIGKSSQLFGAQESFSNIIDLDLTKYAKLVLVKTTANFDLEINFPSSNEVESKNENYGIQFLHNKEMKLTLQLKDKRNGNILVIYKEI